MLQDFLSLRTALGPSFSRDILKNKAAGYYGKRLLFVCLLVVKLWKEAEPFWPCQELNTCCWDNFAISIGCLEVLNHLLLVHKPSHPCFCVFIKHPYSGLRLLTWYGPNSNGVWKHFIKQNFIEAVGTMSNNVPICWLSQQRTQDHKRCHGACALPGTLGVPSSGSNSQWCKCLLNAVRVVPSLGSTNGNEWRRTYLTWITCAVSCPHYWCQAEGRVLAVCLYCPWWSKAECQQSAYVAGIGHRAGCQEAGCHLATVL